MKKSVLIKTMLLSVLLSGVTTLSRAQIGSIDFPGTEQYIQFFSSPITALTGDCTIETWFYHRGGGAWQRIIGFGGSDRFLALMPNAHPSVGGGVWFAMSNTVEGQQQLLSTSTPLTLNTWHHIAITITHATNTGRMFIDGNLVATNTNMTLRPGLLDDLGLWRFGRSNFLGDPYFNGYIDEIRFSTKVRYTTNFVPGRLPATPDVFTAGLWSFDEGMGQTLFDYSGNGHHAMIGSEPGVDDQDPQWSMFNTLPIKFQSFTTHQAGAGVKLKWTTSMIDNDADFIVEKSLDGKKFGAIGTIAVLKNGHTHFEYDDMTKANGKVYYRIKMVELTKVSYSRIAMRNMAGGSFKIQTNLVRSKLNITTDDARSFVITDVVGRAVQKFNLPGSGDVDVSHLRPGVYFLNNNNGTVVRFVKQ